MYSSTHTAASTYKPYLSFVAFLLTGCLAVSAAQASVYDFENLVNGVLQGRDGWLDAPGSGLVVIRTDDTPVNGTQVAKPDVGVLSGAPGLLTRVNNASFGFSAFFGTETQVVLEADLTAEAQTGFGLGADVNGNGIVTAGEGELGPVFGALRDAQAGVEQFGIMAANEGTKYLAPLTTETRCCNEDSDWYRMQLRMDLTANGGAGSGSLFYMNLTRGDTEFQPVSELQNVNLGLTALLPEAGPTSWNAMWITTLFEGNQSVPSIDNLVPRVPIVMQRDGGLSIQAVDAINQFGAKFDVALQSVQDPVDPSGLFWQLARVEIAESTVPSAAVLLPGMDLILDSADIAGVYPGLGTVSDICLEFQGWDGEHPRTMVWKYVAVGCQ